MPWFKIDDSSHSHPKFVRAGNAALGLWLRCGAYSAQHLLEGAVPGDIAKLYGTGPQAAKLVKVGLWHDATHTCPRCPRPADGDYIIHDFFEAGRNSTRAQVEASRKAATERKQKSRANQNADGNANESKRNRPRFVDENSENPARKEPQFQDSTAGQEWSSHRDAMKGVTPPHAAAMPYQLPPTEVAAAAEQPAGIPDALADLKRGIAAAGLTGIAWNLRASQWEHTRQAMDRVGIPAMVAYAANSARLRGTPATAAAWVDGWKSLEAAPANNGVTYLPAVPQPPSKNQIARSLFDEAANRLAAGGTA